METMLSSIRPHQAVGCAVGSDGAGSGSFQTGCELLLGLPLASTAGFNFLHPQNKDSNVYCWIPASLPPCPAPDSAGLE